MSPEQLKRARLLYGWSQQEAADRLGVTQAYLSMLESGRRDMTHLSRKLMQVYGLSPTVLPVQEVRENATPDFLAHELAWDTPVSFICAEKQGKQIPLIS
jgi:transcriptional regulator with XRE-family HTH domain